jgi:hypothetical protein
MVALSIATFSPTEAFYPRACNKADCRANTLLFITAAYATGNIEGCCSTDGIVTIKLDPNDICVSALRIATQAYFDAGTIQNT